ncbi:MAG: peptide chain release factor N(5)-glutamine methyltransferase [Bacteroidetes bacterium]|nr:peptide chain release factor N(5)-glutamine methyltransferase [Bacteroidota bacterium]
MTIFSIKQLYQTNLQEKYSLNEISAILKLLAEDCNISHFDIATNPHKEFLENEEQFFMQALERLQTNEPIQYIRGKADFYGLEFDVSPAVLIPRGETELLVHVIVQRAQYMASTPLSHRAVVERSRTAKPSTKLNDIIIDACTGSGCIAIALAKNLPQAKIYACDISAEALEIAKRNAQKNNVAIEFLQCDILQQSAYTQLPQCSILVSNPPYVMESEKAKMHANVLDFEPDLALFVSNENPLLFYDALAQLGLQILQSKGILFCEINEALGLETQQLFKNYGYTQVEILCDLHDKQRFVRCVRE